MTRQEQDAIVMKIMEKAIKQIEACNEWYNLEVLTSVDAMKKIKSILKECNQDLNNLLEEITKSTEREAE